MYRGQRVRGRADGTGAKRGQKGGEHARGGKRKGKKKKGRKPVSDRGSRKNTGQASEGGEKKKVKGDFRALTAGHGWGFFG